MFAQDEWQREGTCVKDILHGVSFWADKTPNDPALLYPRHASDTEMETVTWVEFKCAIQLAKQWLCDTLQIPKYASGVDESKRTVTLLIGATQDNMCLWIALAQMGYSTQFISLAHQPDVIASLIERSASPSVVFGGLESAWLEESRQLVTNHTAMWIERPSSMTLNGLLDYIRHSDNIEMTNDKVLTPSPFVILHSFGSTSMPKLYPLTLESANLSAQDSAAFWIATPAQDRWRRQLQTSLCFHFSFQQPVWRMLTCGTTLVFPAIRANGSDDSMKTVVTAQQSKGGSVLVPSATDILDSLAMSGADVLYASPSGLENVALTVLGAPENSPWTQAMTTLKQAHTGGAPVSRGMSDTYERAGMEVMQVFATTEAGMLFIGKKAITGHLCNLTPRPHIKDKLLFFQANESDDTLQLWLPSDFPGLQKHGLTFEPFPGNRSIQAWNTSDTFAKLTPDAPLYEFRGRSDDWLRLTSGTACRALELEDDLMNFMRQGCNDDDGGSSPLSPSSSSFLSASSSSDVSSTFSQQQPCQDQQNAKHIEAVTVLGNARKTLSAVVQLQGCAAPTNDEVKRAERAAEWITKEKLQYPAVLQPKAVFFATSETPIHRTQKGSVQRKKNEQTFASLLDRSGF